MPDRSTSPRVAIRAFGLATIALGLSQLAFGNFTNVWYPVPAQGPMRTALVYVAALCLMLGGAAVQWWRTERPGLVLLAFLYTIAALLWVPRIILLPRAFGTWAGSAEELSMVAAAMMAHAASGRTAASGRAFDVARVALAVCVLAFAGNHLTAIPQTAAMVPGWLPPGQRFWAIATAVAFLLAGAAILTRVRAVLAARLLAAMLALFALLVWMPIVVGDPHGQVPWTGAALTFAIAGGAWMAGEVLGDRV